MRKKSILAAQTIAALLFCFLQPTAAVGAPFAIDSTQSFLTISGTGQTFNGSQPISPQSLGSLTDYFSGNLLLDLQNSGQIRVVGSSINGISQPGPFQPTGGPADFAGQLPSVFQAGGTGYFATQNDFVYTTSNAMPLDSSGNFNASGINLRLASNKLQAAAVPFGPVSGAWHLELTNVAAGPASLTTVGDQYRVLIPFQATAVTTVGVQLNLTVTGQLVATRPIAGATAPDIFNGGFEGRYTGPGTSVDNSTLGWTTVSAATPNNFGGIQNPAGSDRPQPTEGLQEVFINVHNDTASLYQTILSAGALHANTKYAVTFDVGNRDVTDNGRLPNNDMDPFIGVKGFFTLGNNPVDYSIHVGDAYQLAQLSSIAEGTWSRDHTIVLDTALLTPELLAMPLNFVLQATSTTTLNRGQVTFDNVRLSIVPEPSTYALAGVGMVTLLAIKRRKLQG